MKTVTAIALLSLLAGCVGGPGSYFESITRESAKNSGSDLRQEPEQPATLALETVDQNDLAPLGQPQPATSEAGNRTTQANSPATRIEQADNGTTLLTVPETITLPGTNQDSEQTANSGQPLQTPRPAIASLTPPTGLEDPLRAYADPAPALPGNGTLLNETGSGFSLGVESEPIIDPFEQAAEQRIAQLYPAIDHGQCKTGRGPEPKMMGAKRIESGHPYYIEIRMRQTPLMPVGHTYVAYGRLDANGEILDEKLIMLAPYGGYVGAAIASGVPMPGVLTPHTDDCRIRPDLAYRVSLSAQKYEMLLREIKAAKTRTPSYLLFANNCNHFMTRIAGSVGIKPPANIYVPAVRYLHDMIEANEGIRIARGWNPKGWERYAAKQGN